MYPGTAEHRPLAVQCAAPEHADRLWLAAASGGRLGYADQIGAAGRVLSPVGRSAEPLLPLRATIRRFGVWVRVNASAVRGSRLARFRFGVGTVDEGSGTSGCVRRRAAAWIRRSQSRCPASR